MFRSILRFCATVSRRRAFDVGSGSIKCIVADVDVGQKQIERELYKSTSQVLLLPGVSKSGSISEDIKTQVLHCMNQCLTETKHFGITESYAIATQAFRQATNGKEVVKYLSTQTNVPMHIASVEEEAQLGFLTAFSVLPKNCAPEHLIVWDCGAASFQFASLNAIHTDKHGSGTARQLAISTITAMNGRQSLNPLSLFEIDQLINLQTEKLKPAPSWLFSCLGQREIVAIGGSQSIFNQQRILSGLSAFNQNDVYGTILSLAGLNNKELTQKEEQGCRKLCNDAAFRYNVTEENAEYILPKLILLLSIMRRASISQVRFFETTGNCSSLLVHEALWKPRSFRSSLLSSPLPSVPKISHLPKSSFSTLATPSEWASKTSLKSPEHVSPVSQQLLTINWHLEKDCNYKCKFCYAHFAQTLENLPREAGFELLAAMKNFGVFKVNFAGGEPLLNKNLGEYIRFAKTIGLRTSMITNASLMTLSWLRKYGEFIDQIGISCDSLNDQVNKALGRGFGHHVPTTARAFERINKLNRDGCTNIQIKLNTVVTRKTFEEDWSEFIKKYNIQRWKIFKILRIEGENDNCYDDLSISDEQFQQFVDRHAGLEGVTMAPEDNDDMTGSYLMVTPEGRFFQNIDGKYQYSTSILTNGMEKCLNEIQFDYSKFQRRGGEYVL